MSLSLIVFIDDIAEEVKKTIISDSHKDTIQNEVYTDIREKWVLFLGEVAKIGRVNLLRAALL